ncbi:MULTISPECIES: cryptochrome/photolyase family protein [unclassified Curtobacterium]|uniref:cryptochrome/photolyase family protein n=1 Tax=unclassified Curtobacterium TaxID=257496 RepID=UPI0008DE7D8D|nr:MULTISPECIES: cryptochrome/photolyase family protein [unclassified Curtobacterium]OIH93017.1 deoxyribodipyrimidine photolyase [Curtobacterium sp. MCBA15_003]OII29930.1 deoxyribodipyrimidine photolyase [Curtobacterium sp. MMLR14_006]
MPEARRRLVLPGQYGPLFDDGGPALVVEAREFFAARPVHRAKAHLWLSALRHRVRELGDRAEHVQVDTLRQALAGRSGLQAVDPPSRTMRAEVRHWGHDTEILPSRGFVTDEAEFAEWAAQGTGRFRMEAHYERVRRREGWLMDGDRPVGGRFSLDDENREPPPRGATTLGLPDPWWPDEDDVDEQVRHDLDRWERDGLVRFVGRDDRRRFAVTADEARLAPEDFVAVRLGDFGPFEDATLTNGWTMAHSLLSVPMNLGVLDPVEVVGAALEAHRTGAAPLASVEGFVRQVAGWRDYVWHLYWWFGDEYGASENALGAHEPLPDWWQELDASAIDAACLGTAVQGLHDHGWLHHIQRLMVLGNWALQRGYDPVHLTEWFTDVFVDGTDWVMPANIIGMSQHADGGMVATKPYASGGRYIDRMSDHCGGCRFDPTVRVGADACPFTAGYWAFLARAEDALRDNPRMVRPLQQMRRLPDLDAVVAQEARRTRP